MILFAECLVVCLLFSLGCITSLLKDPLKWISSYPKEIQDRAKALGLVDANKKLMTRHEVIRKGIGSLLLILMLSLMLVYINGAEGFLQGFLLSYTIFFAITWWDALIIDCLWFCHSKKGMIPGTEDLVDSCHDYWFHIRRSIFGMFLAVPLSLLVGLCVMIAG